MTDSAAQILMRQRDHMLTQALAIENKVAGLNMAIKIVAEELAAQGIEAAQAAETATEIGGSVHESPVAKPCAQDTPKEPIP